MTLADKVRFFIFLLSLYNIFIYWWILFITTFQQRWCLYQDTICHVIHNTDPSRPLIISTGVRQGCLLSPLIISLVVDWISLWKMSPVNLGGYLQQAIGRLDFADDIVLLSHTHTHAHTHTRTHTHARTRAHTHTQQQIQEKTQCLDTTVKQTGLRSINIKTKIMRINNWSEYQVMFDDQSIEDVESFTYQGSVINKTGDSYEDVKIRIGKARWSMEESGIAK